MKTIAFTILLFLSELALATNLRGRVDIRHPYTGDLSLRRERRSNLSCLLTLALSWFTPISPAQMVCITCPV